MKKEEIINCFTAMNESSYNTDIYFKELEKLQEQICNTLMPAVLNKKGWYEEIVNQLESDKFNDDNIENVIKPRFINTAIKMSKEIRIKKSGNRGERNITNFLKETQTHFEDSCLMNNVSLKCEDLNVEIDNIFISPKCIFIVETKNWTKPTYINYCGDIYKDNTLEINKNINSSMSNKRIVLWSLLKENGFKNINIQEVIVNANPHNFIKNDCKKLLVLNNPSDIVSFITDFKSNVDYSQDDIENISKVINDNIFSETYPVEYNIEEFKNDAAELVLAMNSENKEIQDDANNDMKTYIFDFVKETFSLKKCAIYALTIGATLMAEHYFKNF